MQELLTHNHVNLSSNLPYGFFKDLRLLPRKGTRGEAKTPTASISQIQSLGNKPGRHRLSCAASLAILPTMVGSGSTPLSSAVWSSVLYMTTP